MKKRQPVQRVMWFGVWTRWWCPHWSSTTATVSPVPPPILSFVTPRALVSFFYPFSFSLFIVLSVFLIIHCYFVWWYIYMDDQRGDIQVTTFESIGEYFLSPPGCLHSYFYKYFEFIVFLLLGFCWIWCSSNAVS